jgi:hypothetical protein
LRCAPLILLALLALPGVAGAQPTLPYTARRLSFSGLTTTVQGDIRTVGMGGATVGLADTFIAALDNPAGLAMTVGVGDIHYATNDIHDQHVQSFDTASSPDSVGLALGLYPWAVSLGYLSHYDEESTYRLQSLLGNPIALRVTTRELVLSAARVFFHNRLSIGAGLILGQAVREMASPLLKLDRSYASYTAGVTVGVTVQLPRRLLFGASFSSPLHYGGAVSERTLPIPGFFQPVEVPWRVSLGLGFIPNRFFRADLTLHLFTATPRTALVRDEAALVGQRVTLQPRLGVAYVFADFKELKSTLFAGLYFESSRIAGTGDRLHGTLGVEARIWIITVGGGIDFAGGYRNLLVSVGADVFGILARLDVIPKFWTPPSNRMFPHPFKFADDGLARPLVPNWAPGARDVDPIQVALKIPGKLGQGLRNAESELAQIGKEVADGIAASNENAQQKQARARRAEADARLAEESERLDEVAWQAEEFARLAEVKKVEPAKAPARPKRRVKRHRTHH